MTIRFSFILIPLLCIVLVSDPSKAAIDAYQFDTESQRQRYHSLVEELRCPKCQNQNLAGSNSQIAMDLRRELLRLLLEGKTDREIKSFMVDRYGDFVLYKPPLRSSTVMLWFFPGLLMVIGVVVLALIVRRNRRLSSNPDNDAKLSDQDLSKLEHLLNRQTDSN